MIYYIMGHWYVYIKHVLCILLILMSLFSVDVPGSAAYFGVYQWILRSLTPADGGFDTLNAENFIILV